MATLYQHVPDADVLLALAPEELARVLLRLVPDYTQNGIFNPDSVGRSPQAFMQTTDAWYPQGRLREVDLAIMEAWAWLTINMLVLPAPEPNGANGFRVLSRRAAAFKTDEDFTTFKAAAAFPRTMLHPRIQDKVWLRLSQGDLDDAVFAAFKAVEVSVRAAAGLADTDIGVALMRKALHPDAGPLTNLSQPAAERQALSDLFAGAIGSYKNPHSHRTVKLSDPEEAQEMVVLASHLLRIVDARA